MDDSSAPNPAENLALIAETRARFSDRMEPDPRLLFGIWGLAWLVGYTGLFVTAGSTANGRPAPWAFILFASVLMAALAVTLVHVAVRVRGVEGVSTRSGAMYGWSWMIGFAGIYLINTGLARAGASEQVLDLAWNALPCLVVGMIYMAGGALWRQTTMFVLGVWIVLVGAVATVVGLPGAYAVMAYAGGGGFLVGSLICQLARTRTRGQARTAR